MPKMKKLCSRVYFYKTQWRFRPAPHHRQALAKIGHSSSWVALGTSERDAMRNYANLMDQIDQQSGTLTGMQRLFDRYQQTVIPEKAERTQTDQIGHLKRLRRTFGHMEPEQVSTAMVQGYLERRGKKSKHQANQEVSTLSQCFKYARVWDLLKGANPAQGVIRHKLAARDRLPTMEELGLFKRHASLFIATYVDFKLETGLRAADIRELKLSQIRSDGIYITTGKTGKRLKIPMTPVLSRSIETFKALAKHSSDYLLSTRTGEKMSKSAFDGRWQSAMHKALTAKSDPLDERFHEHDIRATHATSINSKLDLQAASNNLGHDDCRTTKQYLRSREYSPITPLSEVL